MEANSALLNDQEVTEEIKEEVKKYLEMDDNENTMTQGLGDAAKAVLGGRFVAMWSCLKRQETSQLNKLALHLKQLEKEEPKKPRVGRRKEIIRKRSEINEKETKEILAKINETRGCFFEKINGIDRPLARLIKKKGEGLRSTKLEMKKEK